MPINMESEIFKIVLTSAFTILGGTIVFAFSQVLSKFIIEPIHEQKKLIAEINDALIFYANIFQLHKASDGENEKADKAKEVIRSLSSRLRAKTAIIPWYTIWQKMGLIISSQNIDKAARALMGLSNSVYDTNSHKNVNRYRRAISEALNISVS